MPRPTPDLGTSTRRIAGAITAATGLFVVVVGWWGGIDIVTRLHPSLVSMKANTALCFALVGVALLLDGTTPVGRGIRTTAALLAATVGLVTVVEYATSWSPGLDELLATDRNLIATPYPGRMGLNTSIGFLLIGPAVLLAGARRTGARLLAQLLAATVLLLALLAFLGYALRVASAAGLGSATQMALHTSVLLLLSSFGVLASTTDTGLLRAVDHPGAAGNAARVMLPGAIGALLSSVLAIELLESWTVLEDSRLQLALVVTLGIAVITLVILVIARRLSATEQLATETGRELAAVVASFPDLFARVDKDGTVRSVRGDLQAALFVDGEGHPLAETCRPEIRSAVTEAVDAARRSTTAVERTCHLDEVDHGSVGENGPALAIDARPIRAIEIRAIAQPTGDVAFAIRDVSQLAEAQHRLTALTADLEQRVEQRTDELTRSNAELLAFSHSVAHDLRGPLTTISGFATIIVEGRAGDGEDLRDISRRIASSAARLLDMIDGLLDYAAATVHVREDVPLGDVVEWVKVMTRDQADLAEATVEHGDLPTIHSSRQAMRTVLLNLVANSIKYRDRERALRVRVDGGLDDDGSGWITVSDTGRGIPVEYRKQVFALGQRVQDPQDVGHAAPTGSGVGLHTVARVVERLGGTITAESGPGGVGTTMRITLPDAAQRGLRAMSSNSGSSNATPDPS